MASGSDGGDDLTNNNPGKTKLVVLRLEPAENGSLPKNPFTIRKSVEQFAGKIESGFPENGGTRYALRVSNPDQVKSLLQMNKLIDGTPIVITEHPEHNVIRCVVNCRDVMDLTEEYLLEELASQGVISVRRITRKTDGGLKEDTPSLVLTFSGKTVPEYVFFAFIRIRTSPYYPDLIQCYKCWEFWHTKPNCSCDPICGTCSGSHETEKGKICLAKPYCKKCESSDHPISSRKCPKYVIENAIARFRIDHKLTYEAAKKAYEHTKAKSVQELTEKISDMELMLKKKDHEIQVLRGIFNTMKQAQKPKSENQPTAQLQQKAAPRSTPLPRTKEVPSKTTTVSPPKAETKQSQTLAADATEQRPSAVEDSKSTGKTAGRSGKKKRGKNKK